MDFVNFIYDGTLEGLLTAVFDAYNEKILPAKIISEEESQLGMFEDNRIITTDTEKASRVLNGVLREIGSYGVEDLKIAACSGQEDKGIIIFNYLRAVFKFGKKVESMYNLPQVMDYVTLVQRVGYEIERCKGFIRFRELKNGILYAEYEPDNDITEYLMSYFSKRNNDDLFIIRDVKRDIFGLYNREEYIVGHWTVQNEEDSEALAESRQNFYSDADLIFADLWKQYYKTVSIASRKNERLRRQYMPRRYWKYLIETEGEN